MIRISLLLAVVAFSQASYAQQFGGFPPSVKWKQINTDTARIIFDPAIEAQAQRIATIVHKMAAQKTLVLGNTTNKIDIVLHSNTTLANGYVGLAPFRSEFYIIPSSNIFESGNLPWYEHLAVHEYRHVQQYNNFNRGLSKAFRFVLGEEGQALANGIAIPEWFFEGDAVQSESSLTPQGRGRLPYFLSGYNSLWKADRKYSLMKLLNRSLKDYVPNHYQFGYLLVNYGYQQYGEPFWQKVTQDASAFRGLVYPFRKAIKKYSGQTYRSFVTSALNSYQKKIQTDTKEVQQKRQTVSNYYFPVIIGKDSLLYLKDSYKRLAAFYIKNQEGEHRVKLKNIGSEEWYSYRNGTIAYAAYGTNARWSLNDYSDIILLDISTGKEKKITSKQKYFTPDLSPSGKQLVAIQFTKSTETELHVLTANGELIKKIGSPAASLFLHPRFIDEDNIVIGIRKPDGSVSLHKMNLPNEQSEQLTPSSFSVIGFPSVQANTIYFTAAYQGNDDLYAIKDKKIFQLTSGQTGNYYAHASGNSLVWSQFTANGLQLKRAGINQLQWQELNPADAAKQKLLYPVANATQNILVTPTKSFAVSNYKKSTGLFNFHSWRPFYEDPEFTFSLYGNNILNTFTNEIFYRYNQNERSHGAGFNTSYGALYPVLTAGAEYTYNRHLRTGNSRLPIALFNALELRAGYSIPLNFTQNNLYQFLSLGSNFIINRQTPTGEASKVFREFNSRYLHHFIDWTQQLPRAVQHIFPKWGYSISGDYRQRLDEHGYQVNAGMQLYLPSIFNHSLMLSGAAQQTDTANVLFSNRFANSRGYAASDSSKMWRTSVNYHLPLAYPDWGFGGIVYFLRIRTNLFYDYSKLYASASSKTTNLRSTGAELFFDTRWWNSLPVTFGIRYSYLVDAAPGGSRNRWEFIIPTGLIP